MNTLALRTFAAAAADAATYRTTATYAASDGATSVQSDRIEPDRTIDATSGPVEAPDLTALTFRISDGADLLLADMAIVAGVVQPLAGLERAFGTHVRFTVDLDAFATDPSLGLIYADNH